MGITKKRIRNSKKDHIVKICMIISVVNYGFSLENTEHNGKNSGNNGRYLKTALLEPFVKRYKNSPIF